MTDATVRIAYPLWAKYNRLLRDRVATLTEEQLAIRTTPDRWPLWATIGHVACQRVFAMCDYAGEPGAAESPFPNAAHDCPGDDDLDNVWSAERLVDALDRTFVIVERVLDTWRLASLDEVLRSDWGQDWVRTRGEHLQRSFAHDVWHIAEINEVLGRAGLEQIDPWN